MTRTLTRKIICNIGSKTLSKILKIPSKKFCIHNGIAIRDKWILHEKDINKSYEEPLIKGIKNNVKPSDHVVVIGGGLGASTVVASQAAGIEGQVTVYEGSKEYIEKVEETVKINNTFAPVKTIHGIVGKEISLYGDRGSPEPVELDASDLPDCDVLVMDCEGAEKVILKNLEIRPRSIVVETHGIFDSSTDTVESLLEDYGYKNDFIGYEVEEEDIAVLEGFIDKDSKSNKKEG